MGTITCSLQRHHHLHPAQSHPIPTCTDPSRTTMLPSADQGPNPQQADHHRHPPPVSPPAYSASVTSPAAKDAAAAASATTNPLPPLSPNNDHERMLPPLSSVTGGHSLPIRSDMASVVGQHPASQWPASNPLMQHPGFVAHSRPAQYKADSPLTMDLDTASNSAASAASPDSRSHGRAGSVNLDDPDVWLAAEALGDLRAGEWPP